MVQPAAALCQAGSQSDSLSSPTLRTVSSSLSPAPKSSSQRRIFVICAFGTIGHATVRALRRRGHEVVCFVRPRAGVGGALAADDCPDLMNSHTQMGGNHLDKKRDEIETQSL